MPASEFNVRYVAQLARIDLSAEEVARFQEQLGQVLAFVEKLREIDVSAVEPTAHAHPVDNVFRSDEPRPSFAPEVALANAPRQGHELFLVTKVIEDESRSDQGEAARST